jgi:ribosome-associated protein
MKEENMENFEFGNEAQKELVPLTGDDARELADAIAEVLDSKKGRDIKVLHVEDKTVIAEYFVVCTGNSSTQIKALADEVEYQIDRRGLQPYGVEGRDNNTWLLLDYSNVIVHIFSREAREFYNLDKLYAD